MRWGIALLLAAVLSHEQSCSGTCANEREPHLTDENAARLYPLPVGLTVVGDVPRVDWKENLPFAHQLAKLDRPAILTQTIAAHWGCASWTPAVLAGRLGTSRLQVKRTPDLSGIFHYCHATPFANLTSVEEDYTPRCFQKIDLMGSELFELLDGHDGRIAYAAKLDAWGDEWWSDVSPIEPLIVTTDAESYNPELNHLFRQTHVWLSTPNTTTPAHFDVFHNMFFQISGTKRVLLAPPSAWEFLYVFPVLHPGHRSAQVNLTSPDIRAFPHFRPTDVFQATLGPGDLLYIPPMWFHHVTTLGSPSISLSVWSHFERAQRMAKLLEEPLPFLQSWNHAEKIAALRLFLESIVENLSLGMNVAAFVNWALLEHRYNNIKTDLRDVDRWCIVVEGAGSSEVNQEYLDYSSGAKGVIPIFVGTTDPAYRLKYQGKWVLGHTKGEDRRTMYQGKNDGASSLYGEYFEGLGTSPPPIVRPCKETVRYCYDEQLTEEVKMKAEELLARRIKAAVDVFKLGSADDTPRVHLLLADYFETVINAVVGPSEVRSFLHDFVYC